MCNQIVSVKGSPLQLHLFTCINVRCNHGDVKVLQVYVCIYLHISNALRLMTCIVKLVIENESMYCHYNVIDADLI